MILSGRRENAPLDADGLARWTRKDQCREI